MYAAALGELQFGECDMRVPSGEDRYAHTYWRSIGSDEATPQQLAAKTTRLVQELGAMASPGALPLSPASSVFLRVDEERVDVMRVLITGPAGTPYGYGAWTFDLYCPPAFPEVPPVVTVLTTGAGRFRSNPNLYANGKVCLSLLGTWKGAEHEKWNAKTSTLLQVFVSIQSLIFVEQPYFNEPGHEATLNTPAGDLASAAYSATIRAGTLRWAILEPLRNPPAGFEDVVREHFRRVAAPLREQLELWRSAASAAGAAAGAAAGTQAPTSLGSSTLDPLVADVLAELECNSAS